MQKEQSQTKRHGEDNTDGDIALRQFLTQRTHQHAAERGNRKHARKRRCADQNCPRSPGKPYMGQRVPGRKPARAEPGNTLPSLKESQQLPAAAKAWRMKS